MFSAPPKLDKAPRFQTKPLRLPPSSFRSSLRRGLVKPHIWYSDHSACIPARPVPLLFRDAVYTRKPESLGETHARHKGRAEAGLERFCAFWYANVVLNAPLQAWSYDGKCHKHLQLGSLALMPSTTASARTLAADVARMQARMVSTLRGK